MRGAVLVAIVAAVGNMLQGWDNSTIAGAVLYIKKEFKLETQPTIEGLIVATSLIGATIITTFSGPVSDITGRRPMLILSSLFYFLSGIVMLWAPNVYVLLFARLLDGFGVGLAVTLVPVYISETAPPEIRGTLNTLPQFMGSGGMFVSYCMVFGMSLMDSPSWRLMLGVLSLPSLAYLALTILLLPESPRWLVSKGKMLDAKLVLQRLRGRDDVSGELALLVEGLGVGHETRIEELIIGPGNETPSPGEGGGRGEDQLKIYGEGEGVSWVAKPAGAGQSTLNAMSRQGSMVNQLVDPLVTLFGSVHEALPSTGSRSSLAFPNMSGMIQADHSHWDEENQGGENDQETSDHGNNEDDTPQTPLLSRRGSAAGGIMRRNSSLMNPVGDEGAVGIGGGWHLAYKKGKAEGELERVYLHEEAGVASTTSRGGSVLLAAGGGSFVQAAALVSQPVMTSRSILSNHPDSIHPPPNMPASAFSELFEPGVKRALMVGVGLQILQQLSGINGVLYYTPQILGEAGVSVLLSNLGLSSDSASLLISLLTTLLMLPCITVSMRLMDVAGRRSLMLSTIPILVVSLLALVLSTVLDLPSVLKATVSTVSVMVYMSCFVMGFGAIPNILCSEIFPTRVRGMCITICALTFWLGNIMITYSLPLLLSSLGLAGVFSIYAAACAVSWVFVFLRVPETKGMPLEVISEFFSVGSSALDHNN